MANTKHTKNANDRFDPRPWLIGIAVILAIGMLLFAYYEFIWSKNNSSDYEEFSKVSDGIIENRETGLRYFELSGSYEARYRVTNTCYGKLGKTNLYQLAYKDSKGNAEALSGELYLALSPEDGGKVYIAETQSAPTLAGFKTSTVYVCTDIKDELVAAITSFSGSDATALVNEYLAKEKYEGEGNPYETYRLRLISDSCGWLYYVLYLVRCDNGDYYIYGVDDRTGYAVESTRFHSSLGGAVN